MGKPIRGKGSTEKTRLVRSWTHLERQRGGLSKVGGPGESQLELDKRIIDTKIKQIKNINQILKRESLMSLLIYGQIDHKS